MSIQVNEDKVFGKPVHKANIATTGMKDLNEALAKIVGFCRKDKLSLFYTLLPDGKPNASKGAYVWASYGFDKLDINNKIDFKNAYFEEVYLLLLPEGMKPDAKVFQAKTLQSGPYEELKSAAIGDKAICAFYSPSHDDLEIYGAKDKVKALVRA